MSTAVIAPAVWLAELLAHEPAYRRLILADCRQLALDGLGPTRRRAAELVQAAQALRMLADEVAQALGDVVEEDGEGDDA